VKHINRKNKSTVREMETFFRYVK